MMATIGLLIAGTSCSNKPKNETNSTEQATEKVLEVDSLLANAEQLTNQAIVVEGVCTHTCKHGGTKLFLMGSNDKQTIRAEAGELGSFDAKCVNNIVRIKGVLKEERIDEAYLQRWETELKEKENKEHGEAGEGGCSTEKNARGETADTPDARVADFRAKIAKQQTETGKAYLSFYFIEATDYEIR